MSGFTNEQKGELREIVGEVVDAKLDAKLEPLARSIQQEFGRVHQEMSGLRGEMHTEFGKVFERLDALDDSINYSRQSFLLVTRDLEDTKRRLARVEEKLGIGE